MPEPNLSQLLVGFQAVERGELTPVVFLEIVRKWSQDESRSLSEVIESLSFLTADEKVAIAKSFTVAPASAEGLDDDPDRTQLAEFSDKQLKRLQEQLAQAGDDDPDRTLPQVQSAETAPTEGFDPQAAATLAPPRSSVAAPHGGGTGNASAIERDRFRLIEQHAKGGLGVVYKAVDQQLHRTVALKQMKHSLPATGMHRDKFVVEAEVTGQLEHPGIVPVYALGIDAGNRPFYAMKFISGENLKDRIEQLHRRVSTNRGLLDEAELRKLLRRFIDVCNAIDYAHHRSVLHRDIKPQNIMLGDHGETLVVDWGLAKVLGSSESAPHPSSSGLKTSDSSGPTTYGSFFGTAAYASPEQLLGQMDLLGPATDVYSLGATLYEILAGQPPVRGKVVSLREIVDQLRDGRVPSPRDICRSVPKPLAAVCGKAMAYEPEQRYASARGLASDIERWLADESLAAYADREPVLERMGRLLRRHRSWTIPIAGALLAVTVVSVVAGYLINRARLNERQARTRAVQMKQVALDRQRSAGQAVDSFLLSTEELSDFEFTRDLQRRTLQMAEADYQQLAATISDEAELELERVRAAKRLGDIFHLQRDYATSREQYQVALDLLDQTPWENLQGAMEPQLVATECLVERGKIHSRLGLALDLQGKTEEAEQAYATAHRWFDQVPSGSSGVLGRSQGEYGKSQLEFASLLLRTGRTEQATELCRIAIDKFRTALEDSANDYYVAAAATYETLGRAESIDGNYAAAVAAFENGLELIGKVLNTPANNVSPLRNEEYQEACIQLHAAYALVARLHGLYPAAFAHIDAAKSRYQQLLDLRPDSLLFQQRAARVETNHGLILLDLDRPIDAVESFQGAASVFDQLHAKYPLRQLYQLELATALGGLGQALTDLPSDNLPTAANLFDRSLELSQNLALVANEQQRVAEALRYTQLNAVTRGQYGVLLHTHGELSLAGEQLTRAIDDQQAVVDLSGQAGESLNLLAQLKARLSELEFDRGDSKQAQLAAEQARAIWEQLLEQQADAQYRYQLSEHLVRTPLPAARDLQLARQLCKACVDQHPTDRRSRALYAEILSSLGETAAAEEQLNALGEELESWSADELLAFALVKLSDDLVVEATQAFEVAERWINMNRPLNLRLKRRADEVGEQLAGRN